MKLKTTILLILIILGFSLYLFQTYRRNSLQRTAVIKEIRELQRLETASYTIEKIIDRGATGNVFQQILFGDKILLIAHGQSIAGFDLSQFSEDDIQISGKNISIRLPAPEILVTTLDNSQTKVYDRTRGILNPGDKDLESEAREAAQNEIQYTACAGGILKQASDNGRKQLTALLKSLGFDTVTIEIPEGSC